MAARTRIASFWQLRREARETAEAAIVTLPDDLHIAVVLEDIVEPKIPEITKTLAIEPATIKIRIHRGRLHQRRALAEYLPQRDTPTPEHEMPPLHPT